MKRSLFLAPRFVPFPGGAETYASDLCSHLHETGWHPTVVTEASYARPTTSVAHEKFSLIAVEAPIHQLQDDSRVLWRTLQFGLIEAIWKEVSGLPKFDIVHANSIETLVMGRVVADHFGVPLVATIHEHAPQKQAFGSGRMKLAFQHLAPDILIAPSEFYYQRALAAGTPKEQVARIEHGISASRLLSGSHKKWREDWGVLDNETCVVLIGRIYEPKGILEFVDAIRETSKEIKLKAVIVGPDGPGDYCSEVRRRISKYGLEGTVLLMGEVSPSEIPSVIRSADLLVAPSLAEGFGLSVVEAMLLETPVLASRVGGLAEIISDGVTGELVEPGNVPQLAEAMEKLLVRDDLRQSYSKAAKIVAMERFSATRMAAETANVYETLLRTMVD